MSGRVFVNKIGPEVASLDFSSWPPAILNPEVPYGFAYLATMGQLGMRHRVVPSSKVVLLGGELPAVRQRVALLQGHIDRIADIGAALDTGFRESATRMQLAESLGRVVGNVEAMTEDSNIVDLAIAVTRPLTEEDVDSTGSLNMVPHQTPWWLTESALNDRATLIELFMTPDSTA